MKRTPRTLFPQLLKIILQIVLVTWYQILNAQHEDLDLNITVVPVSPEAASLGKYTEQPVSMFTGIPSISIPVHSVQNNKLSADISLSYHAGGIKVEEVASMTGLGWTLNAGGAIIRQTRGLPDDIAGYGYLWSNYKPSDFTNDIGTQASVVRMQEVLNNNLDLEPDLYSMNFGGYSAQFFFDEAGDYHFKSHQDLRIERIGLTGQEITGWVVTTPDGTKYYFGESKNSLRNAIDESTVTVHGALMNNNLDPYATAWYLLDIVDVNNLNLISFYYQNTLSRICSRSVEKKIWTIQGCEEMDTNIRAEYSESINSGVLIDSISSESTKIKFIKITNRVDVNNSKALDKILIYNSDNELFKEYQLFHSYFQTIQTPTDALPCMISVDERTKRLRLDSLVQKDGNGNALPSYIFEYNSVPLPERFSRATDFWGYYNGEDQNTTSIPAMEYINGSNHISFDGANRNSNDQYSVAANLTRITYPTGGTVSFEYEGNRASKTAGSQIPGITEDRLLNIVDTDNQVYQDTITVMSYENGGVFMSYQFMNDPGCTLNLNDCHLSAEIRDVNDPVHINFIIINDLSDEFYIPNGQYVVTVNNFIGNFNFDRFNLRWKEVVEETNGQINAGGLRVKKVTSDDNSGNNLVTNYSYSTFADPIVTSGAVTSSPILGWRESDPGCTTCELFIRASISQYPLATTRGGYVGYSNVTEAKGENGGNGYTRYYYSFDYDEDDLSKDFPFAPPNSYEVNRGDLTATEYFDEQASLLQRNQFNYETLTAPSDFYFQTVRGFKIAGSAGGACFTEYPTRGVWRRLNSESKSSYDHNGQSFTTSKEYTYGNPENHIMLTELKTNLENSTYTRVKYVYAYNSPVDFLNSNGSPVDSMISRYAIGQVLENQTYKSNSVGEQLVNAQGKNYYMTNGNLLPVSSWRTVDGVDFQEVKIINVYDDMGRIIQATNYNEPPQSFIWHANKDVILAKVLNADPDQIFYNSFEYEPGASSAESKTGTHSFYGDYTVSIPSDTEQYLISWWSLVSSSWTFQSVVVPGNSSSYTISSATSYIDEVRMHPIDASMTTYSYDPNNRVVSISDENGISTHFEYDVHGRLKNVLDNDFNVLQQSIYKYGRN